MAQMHKTPEERKTHDPTGSEPDRTVGVYEDKGKKRSNTATIAIVIALILIAILIIAWIM